MSAAVDSLQPTRPKGRERRGVEHDDINPAHMAADSILRTRWKLGLNPAHMAEHEDAADVPRGLDEDL